MRPSKMSIDQPSPPEAAQATFWQAPSTSSPDYRILARVRSRLVALVAALVVQATIALLGVLPDVPGARDQTLLGDPYYGTQPVSFWVQFAVIEFIAAIVVSLAFGPTVDVGDLPMIGRLVLGLGFVAVPVAVIVLGAIYAAQAAAVSGQAAAASSWLTSFFFGTVFLGLPLIALAVHAPQPPSDARPA